MDSTQIQQAMANEFPFWQRCLESAGDRHRSSRPIQGVSLRDGKYLYLHYEPEVGGKYRDKGELAIGNAGSAQAEAVAAHAQTLVGQTARILNYLDDGGYKRVAWVGPLPADLEVGEPAPQSSVPWQGPNQQPAQQPMQPAQQPAQQPMQPAQQPIQPAQQPMQQVPPMQQQPMQQQPMQQPPMQQ